MRVVIGTALVTGAGASLLLFVLAEVIARNWLDDPSTASLLRAACLSAQAFVLIEAVQGTLIGLLRFRTVLLMSAVSGPPLVLGLAWAAGHDPSWMVLVHGFVFVGTAAIGAIAIRLPALLLRRFKDYDRAASPSVAEIVGFGSAQLLTNVGATAASLIVIWLIRVDDPSFTQIGYYALGNQVRALVGLVPGMFSLLVLPMLARATDERIRDVVAVTTLASAVGALLVAFPILLAMPYALMLFGGTYQRANFAACLLAATAVVQLTGAPAAQYLMTVSLRTATIVSQIGSASLVVAALLLVGPFGATGVAAAWLAANVLATGLAFAALRRYRALHWVAFETWCVATIAVIAVALAAWGKKSGSSMHVGMTLLQACVAIIAAAALFRTIRHHGYGLDVRVVIESLWRGLVGAREKGG